MSKREAPALKLTVEDGRLVPASAWDQERLMTYRNRSTVNAYITQDKPRWKERKYWSILDRVITTCGLKQRTAEDLHDHIKLKLGFVNAKFDDAGNLKVTLKSTKLMEDAEYEGFFKEAMDYLFEITGVDPLTLKKEAADVGEDEQPDPSENPPSSDGGSDGSTVHPDAPAVAASPIEPAEAADQEAGEPEADHPDTAAPASDLSPDDKAFLVRVFKTMKAAVGPEVNVLKRQALMFTDEIGGKSDLVRAKAKTIREQLQECCGDEPAKGTVAAAKYIAGIVGVDEKELAE